MLMLKVCHACDSILGELEIDNDLTEDYPDSIMNVVGNVAYTLCPDCLRLLEVEPDPVYH
ncbi:MAG: hypothetical protein ACYCVD_08335 [Desulfitobacteriaceae bacterium]